MLVARERFDYDLPLHYGKRPQIKRVRRIRTQTKMVYCSIVLVTLCLAFLVASRYAEIAKTGYDILALKKQVQSLEVENQAFQAKIDELKSLKNIEYLATTRLGMQEPELAEGVQFVPVEYSKAGSKEAVGIASADDTDKQPGQEKQKRNFLVQTLAKIING